MPPSIYIGPVAPRSTGEPDAALAMGMASALCDLLNRRGVPMSVLDPGDVDFGDVESAVLRLVGAPGEPHVVVGTFTLGAELSFALAVVDTSRHVVIERHLIGRPSSLDDTLDELAKWIERFGTGISQAIEPEPAPADFEQLRTQAYAYGLEWHVQRAPSLFDRLFHSSVERTARHFEQHIADPFAGRRLRGMVLLVTQIMLDRREIDDAAPVVGAFASVMDPPGSAELMAVIEHGVRAGADRHAFGFCKGHVLAILGRTDEALGVYRALTHAPLAARFFSGRALDMAERLEEAVSEYRVALSLAGDADEFVDLARASDAEPTGEQERWRPLVEATLAQTLMNLDRQDEAEVLLRDALRRARHRIVILELLTSLLLVCLERELPTSRRWRERAVIYLDALADLHDENPSNDVAVAGVELATQLGDAARKSYWQAKVVSPRP
jgi:tetratricopeptide (TPR) repeat protein